MEAEARASSARIAADGLDPFRESLWLASLTYLTDAGAALGDEETAALVYPELEPLAGGNVMIGHLVACYGAADRYLGMLAATLGEWERAEAHFERALALNRRWGRHLARPHAYEYGRFAARPRRRPRRPRRCWARPRRSPSRIGHAGPARAHPRARPAPPPAPALPDGLSPREARSSASSPAGLSNRQVGPAVDQRAHGRQPRAQHPAQDRLREPHRGGHLRPPHGSRLTSVRSSADAPLHHRAQLRRELDLTDEDVKLIDEINADEGVRWLFSFLSADRRRTYCLYEAPSPDAIMAAAKRANVPVDEVVEVGAAAPELTGPPARLGGRRAASLCAVYAPLVLRGLLPLHRPPLAAGVAAVLVLVGVETLVLFPLGEVAAPVSLGVVYLLGVLLVAIVWGAGLGVAHRVVERARVQLLPHPADRPASRSPTARTGSRSPSSSSPRWSPSSVAEAARVRARRPSSAAARPTSPPSWRGCCSARRTCRTALRAGGAADRARARAASAGSSSATVDGDERRAAHPAARGERAARHAARARRAGRAPLAQRATRARARGAAGRRAASASGCSARSSRRARCAAATCSRPRCCAPSRTTCARR